MNELLAVLTLLGVTGLLIVLPLIPALVELHRPSDAEPLRIVLAQDTNIRHFAQTFRILATGVIDAHRETVANADKAVEATFGRDERCRLIPKSVVSPVTQEERKALVVTESVIACGDLELPAGMVFEHEVYAAGNVRVCSDTAMRSVLAERDLLLEDRVTIARWAHAGGTLHASTACQLFGRCSSDGLMLLDAGCVFERVQAPVIRFGGRRLGDIRAVHGVSVREAWKPPADAWELDETTLRIEGDVEIPDNAHVTHSLVVTGDLFVGGGTLLDRAVKCHGRLTLAPGTVARGALVTEHDLVIGEGCLVRGPVIGETSIRVDSGCLIGTPKVPTTVSAPRMVLSPGTQLCGSAWADVEGRVVPATEISVT